MAAAGVIREATQARRKRDATGDLAAPLAAGRSQTCASFGKESAAAACACEEGSCGHCAGPRAAARDPTKSAAARFASSARGDGTWGGSVSAKIDVDFDFVAGL